MSGTVTDGSPDNNHAAASGNHGTDGGGGFATANSDGTFMRVDGEDDWEIGGRNYFSNNLDKWESGFFDYTTGVETTNPAAARSIEPYPIEGSTEYTIQLFTENSRVIIFEFDENLNFVEYGYWTRYSVEKIRTFKTRTSARFIRLAVGNEDNTRFDIDSIPNIKIKLEKGNKATDWSPAPEDVDNTPADGKPINCNKLELMTYNNVTNKANINLQTGERNRIDYIETVKYTFEHNRMGIEVELEALEDFYINWYMGLQLTRPGWNRDAYFNHDLEKTKLYIQDNAILNSGTKGNSPQMQRATMRNSKGDVIHVMLDNEYGIGYSKIRDTDPICYLRDSFQKFYFHLVKNNNVLIVPKGEKVKYRGAYIFGKNKAKNATNVTYFTENGIKKAYVDFKVIATENIQYTSVEESFNCSFGNNTVTSTEPNAYAKLIL